MTDTAHRWSEREARWAWALEYVETAPVVLYFDAEGNVGVADEVLS